MTSPSTDANAQDRTLRISGPFVVLLLTLIIAAAGGAVWFLAQRERPRTKPVRSLPVEGPLDEESVLPKYGAEAGNGPGGAGDGEAGKKD